MGPRLKSRGMTILETNGYSADLGLQWGRGLRAAECDRLGNRRLDLLRLQWGRGLRAAEWRAAPVEDTNGVQLASMGPRLKSRGMLEGDTGTMATGRPSFNGAAA